MKRIKNSANSEGPSDAFRNIVRGFQDRKIFEERPSVYRELFRKIYGHNSLKDIRWIENELRTRPLYGHVPLPKDFNLNGDPFDPWSFEKIENKKARLVTVIDRINNSSEKICGGLKSISHINACIFSGELNAAADLVDSHINEFGLSHLILRKIAFLRSIGGDGVSKELESLLTKANMSRRDIIRPSLADAYSFRRQYLDVAKNIFRVTSIRPKTLHRKTISSFAVKPLSYNIDDFHAGLEAFSKTSLLDSVVFLSLHLAFPGGIDYLDAYMPAWENASADVKASLQDLDYDVDALGKYYTEEGRKGEIDDYDMYRHMSAFIECGNTWCFKSVADFYLLIPAETEPEPSFVARSRESIFGNDVKIEKVASSAKSTKMSLSQFDDAHAGTFQKTVAMAIYFRNRLDFDDMNEGLFLKLMNSTTGADQVLSRRVLNSLKTLSERRGELLFKVIVLCLLAVDPTDSKSEFELRRTSQDLVSARFNSDFSKLVEYLLLDAYQVGVYIYMIATEDFLLQLYHLHPTSAGAIECRAVLHEVMYRKSGDRVFQDRADGLRLTAKIAKARHDLDDSRIYVDLSRFATWLKEQRLQNVLQFMRSGAIDLDALEAMTTKDINASQGVEAEIVRELSALYKEFCSNKIFGIASYLGRRIRHGTLRGTLLQDLDGGVLNRFPELCRIQAFEDYFSEWKANFDDFIKRMGNDYFHIRSPQKPLGVISPEISDGKKLAVVKAAAKAMAINFEKFEEPDYYVGMVTDMCWQIASVDLTHSHRIISGCKLRARVNALPDAVRNAIGAQARDYVRYMNEHLEEKFNTVINWFDRPKISVPSVDLPTLVRVVNEEVSEEFSEYIPPIIDDSSSQIVLTGVSYHIVYDFLYVALKNAAKHGRIDAEVYLNISNEQNDGRITSLSFNVSSQYRDGDSMFAAQVRVDECRLDALETAYVEEGKSGLRKIVRLQRDWQEVKSILVQPLDAAFTVQMELRLL